MDQSNLPDLFKGKVRRTFLELSNHTPNEKTGGRPVFQQLALLSTWTGVDSVREQEKLEAKKMLEMK